MRPSLLEIGPLEMEVLGHLGESGEHAVTAIQGRLKHSGRKLAYTTVMTVLVRLFKKGLVGRRKEGRQFLYFAMPKAQSGARQILARVKNSLFRASRLQPILSLLDQDENLSREELQELRRAVDEKLRGLKK